MYACACCYVYTTTDYNTQIWSTDTEKLDWPSVGILGVCTSVRISSTAAVPQIIPTAPRTLCHVRAWFPVSGDPCSHLANISLGWSARSCSWATPSRTKGLTSSANPRSYHLGATRGTAKHTISFRVGWSLSDVTTAPAVRNAGRKCGEVMSVHAR